MLASIYPSVTYIWQFPFFSRLCAFCMAVLICMFKTPNHYFSTQCLKHRNKVQVRIFAN